MTLEEVWRAAFNWFNKPNAVRAVNFSGSCLYRTASGARCAIGVSIPDDIYSPVMEDVAIFALVRDFPELKPIFGNLDSQDLQELQDCHDRAETIDAVRENLRQFGISHGFNPK